MFTVRRRLGDVNRALADLRPLQDERRMLHERLRVLDPQMARPLKYASLHSPHAFLGSGSQSPGYSLAWPFSSRLPVD